MPSHSREADERALDVNEEAYSLSEEPTEWYLHVPPALILKLLQPNLSWAEARVVQNCLSDTAGQSSAGCAVQ